MTDPFTSPSDPNPGDFRRTHQGAPRVTRPDDPTKTDVYSRPSGFGIEVSTYNLLKWKERQLVVGLLELLGDEMIDREDRDSIDRLVDDAYTAAQTSLAADRGTHVHLLCEVADESHLGGATP